MTAKCGVCFSGVLITLNNILLGWQTATVKFFTKDLKLVHNAETCIYFQDFQNGKRNIERR